MADYVSFSARISSFREGQGRATAKSRRKVWPHEKPTANELASAGFYFNPSTKYPDNVTCFLCARSLDGWESTDDPFQEHSVHCPDCPWVVSVQGSSSNTDEALQARLATFATSWPHDGKIGWHATSEAMASAGFYFKPSSPDDDTVACTFCGLILDGWEPKDDPREEHYSRCPDCLTFAKPTKTRRSSRQSKRVSTASARSSSTTRSIKRSSSLAFDEGNDNIASDTDRSDDQAPIKRRTSKRISSAAAKRASTSQKQPSKASENKVATKRTSRIKKPASVRNVSVSQKNEENPDAPAEESPSSKISEIPKIKKEDSQLPNDVVAVKIEETKEAVVSSNETEEIKIKGSNKSGKGHSAPKPKLEKYSEPEHAKTNQAMGSPSDTQNSPKRNEFEKAKSPLKKSIVSSPSSDDHAMSASRLPRQRALGNLYDVLSSPTPGPLSSLFEVHCDEEEEQNNNPQSARKEYRCIARAHQDNSSSPVKKSIENNKLTKSPIAQSPANKENSPLKPPVIDMDHIFDDCLFSENEKGKMLMEFAKNVPDEHLDKTFSEWIKYIAKLAEQEVSDECERLVGIIKTEQEKARQYIMALPTVEA